MSSTWGVPAFFSTGTLWAPAEGEVVTILPGHWATSHGHAGKTGTVAHLFGVVWEFTTSDGNKLSLRLDEIAPIGRQ